MDRIDYKSKKGIEVRENVIFLILFLLLLLGSQLKGQNLIFYSDFECQKDTTFIFKNSKVVSGDSYSGEKSIRILSDGNAQVESALLDNCQEISVSSTIKVQNNSRKGILSIENPSASILVEASDGSQWTSLIKQGQEWNFYDNCEWVQVSRDFKITPNIKKLRLTYIASKEAQLLIDDIAVEKRVTGFVKKGASWAKQVQQFEEKSKRIVKNGDFETGAANWNSYWGFNLSDVAYSGKFSCLIQNSDSGAWKGTSNLKPFVIPEGGAYLRISAWVKADNVKPGPNAWETGALLITFQDKKGNEVPGGEALARSVGTHDWKKFENIFPLTERSVQFTAMLQLAASTGKMYFDDIYAEVLTEEEFYKESIKLKNPGFEMLLSGWPTYAGKATDEQAHTGQYSLCVGGTDAAWEMRLQTISIQKGKDSVTVGMWMKATNITNTPNIWEGGRSYVEFKDLNGLVLKTENIGRVVGNTEWTYVEQRLAIPAETVFMTLQCGRAGVAGNVYFDDVMINY